MDEKITFKNYMSGVEKRIRNSWKIRSPFFNARKELDYSINYLRRNLRFVQRNQMERGEECCLDYAGSSRFHFRRALVIADLLEQSLKFRKGLARVYLEFEALRSEAAKEVRGRYPELFDEESELEYSETKEIALRLLKGNVGGEPVDLGGTSKLSWILNSEHVSGSVDFN